jgi:hypothetical protein
MEKRPGSPAPGARRLGPLCEGRLDDVDGQHDRRGRLAVSSDPVGAKLSLNGLLVERLGLAQGEIHVEGLAVDAVSVGVAGLELGTHGSLGLGQRLDLNVDVAVEVGKLGELVVVELVGHGGILFALGHLIAPMGLF